METQLHYQELVPNEVYANPDIKLKRIGEGFLQVTDIVTLKTFTEVYPNQVFTYLAELAAGSKSRAVLYGTDGKPIPSTNGNQLEKIIAALDPSVNQDLQSGDGNCFRFVQRNLPDFVRLVEDASQNPSLLITYGLLPSDFVSQLVKKQAKLEDYEDQMGNSSLDAIDIGEKWILFLRLNSDGSLPDFNTRLQQLAERTMLSRNIYFTQPYNSSDAERVLNLVYRVYSPEQRVKLADRTQRITEMAAIKPLIALTKIKKPQQTNNRLSS